MNNKLKLGAITSYIRIIVNLLTGIILTPFMLKMLGQGEFGLYSLIGALVAYFSILDFGFGNTLLRYIAKYRVNNDRDNENKLISFCLVMYCMLSIIIALIGAIIFFNFESIFHRGLSSFEINKAKVMLIILILNLMITLPLSTFSSVIRAYERSDLFNIVDIIKKIIRAILLVLLLFNGFKSISIVLLDATLNILFFMYFFFFAIRRLKIRVAFGSIDKQFATQILTYSFFVFLISIGDQIFWKIGQVILGVYRNTDVVAIFSIAMMFVSYFLTFSNAIMGVLIPHITQLVEKNGDAEQLTEIFIKFGRIQYIVVSYVLLSFIVFGQEFIQLWAGEVYLNAYIVSLIIMIPLAMEAIGNSGTQILYAKNKHRIRSYLMILSGTINIILSILLVNRFGIYGVTAGTALSFFLIYIVPIHIYYYRFLSIKVSRLYFQIFNDYVVLFFILLGIGYTLNYLIDTTSWATLLIKVSVFSLCYLFLLYKYGMNDYEKSLIRSFRYLIISKFK